MISALRPGKRVKVHGIAADRLVTTVVHEEHALCGDSVCTLLDLKEAEMFAVTGEVWLFASGRAAAAGTTTVTAVTPGNRHVKLALDHASEEDGAVTALARVIGSNAFATLDEYECFAHDLALTWRARAGHGGD